MKKICGLQKLNFKPVTFFMSSIVCFASVCISSLSYASETSSIQLQCKIKAKDAAQSAYTSCLNNARELELEKIKREYKEKLDKLKNFYERKIKTIGDSSKESKEAKENKEKEAAKESSLESKDNSKETARKLKDSNYLPAKQNYRNTNNNAQSQNKFEEPTKSSSSVETTTAATPTHALPSESITAENEQFGSNQQEQKVNELSTQINHETQKLDENIEKESVENR